MDRLSATKVRAYFADILNKVKYGGERIILHRRDKDIAALVSIDDLRFLEAMEDILDLESAKKSLQESGTMSLEEVKAKLGLS